MIKYILFLLLPVCSFAQTVQDTTAVKSPLGVIKTAGKRDTLQIQPSLLSQIDKATTDINSTINAVNSLNGIMTANGLAIIDLQNQLSGLQVTSKPLPVNVYDNTYTLKESDNNADIFVHVTCTITCPNLFEGFSCRIIRFGTGRVQVLGAKSPSGLTIINGQYREVYVSYRTNSDRVLFGQLTR
jgi:hypothetical protein